MAISKEIIIILLFVGFLGLVTTTIIIALYRKKIRDWWVRQRYRTSAYQVLLISTNGEIDDRAVPLGADKYFRIGTESYKFIEKNLCRWNKKPCMLYIKGIPNPLDFSTSTIEIGHMSSQELDQFRRSDLFAQLIRADTEEKLIMTMMWVSVVTLIVVVAIGLKVWGAFA